MKLTREQEANKIYANPEIKNIYCSRCASEHNLPKVRNQGYAKCMVCGEYKPCYAASNGEIHDNRNVLLGRKVA